MLNLNKYNGNEFYDFSRVFFYCLFILFVRCLEVENIYFLYIIIYYMMKRVFFEYKNEFYMFDRDFCLLYLFILLIC